MDQIHADAVAMMRDRARGRPPSEARAPQPPASAAPEPEAASAQDLEWLPATSMARQYRDPTLRMVIAFIEPLFETLDDAAAAIGKLKAENAGLRTALAELKASLAETRSKADTTDFVVPTAEA